MSVKLSRANRRIVDRTIDIHKRITKQGYYSIQCATMIKKSDSMSWVFNLRCHIAVVMNVRQPIEVKQTLREILHMLSLVRVQLSDSICRSLTSDHHNLNSSCVALVYSSRHACIVMFMFDKSSNCNCKGTDVHISADIDSTRDHMTV
jgi:hypothetical protein